MTKKRNISGALLFSLISLTCMISIMSCSNDEGRLTSEESITEEEETEEYTGLLGEFNFTSGEDQAKPSEVKSGITISNISMGDLLESEYADDALILSNWKSVFQVGGGRWVGFEINNMDGYEYEVDSVTVVMRRSDNIPNKIRLSYDSDSPNATQILGTTITVGSSSYQTYALEPNAESIADQSTPFFAIGVRADSKETTVAFDRISVHGRLVEVPMEVTVNADMAVHSISDRFWGTNLRHWIENDASLQDGKIADSLKDMGIQILRYPGGTVADNFHWETNSLENINMFPYESGASETDFDEFMAQCRKIGAKPSLVLNTESWAVKNDIPGGAHEAADWLRYCKSEGYEVACWEVGNETYWHPVLSAAEYADLVNIYSDSLRKVDPNVIIGVNGHKDVDFVSTKERIKPEAYEELMDYRRNIDSREANQQYKDFKSANTLQPNTLGNTKWWETVAERCGANVDMIIIHWYFSPNQLDNVSQKLLEIRNVFAQKHPSKNYLFNMNEYNVANRYENSHTYLTEMIGVMLEGKIDMTAFWPMRTKQTRKELSLLDFETNRPSIMFEIHRYLSEHLTNTQVETDAPDFIPAFASRDGEKCTVVLTGSKLSEPSEVTVNITGQDPDLCEVWRISGSEFDYQKSSENTPVEDGKTTVHLSPGEVVVAVFE